MDSLSFYDDVNAPSLGGDLYESIAGSILNLAKRNSSMEDMYSSVLYSPQKPVSIAESFYYVKYGSSIITSENLSENLSNNKIEGTPILKLALVKRL